MGNNIILETKFVADISGSFYIPSYQRGYRWSETEVVRLLDDIYQNGKKNYCLQPVVVRKKDNQYELIDPIRSVTVRAINLFEEDCPIQYDLFTDVKSLDRQERLDAAIEQIRFRFGKDAIKNGVLFQKSKMPTERKVDLVMPTGMIG